MSYPNLPKNRLIVNGIDLTERYLMILADGYTLSAPEPKTYTVDIPGGNGVIDLTESLNGDVVYDNREQSFIFYVINIEDFERYKTEVTNFLHGRSFDYKMTMDPDYTYHGRFTIASYAHSMYSLGIVGVMEIKIDAEPYKRKSDKVYSLNANGGKMFYFESGRKQIQPKFECSNPTTIVFNDKELMLPQGTYTSPEIWFKQGWNEIYLNSMQINTLTWDELKDLQLTWDAIKQYRWFELEKYGSPNDIAGRSWSEIASMRWNDLATMTWDDLSYKDAGGRISTTYVSYNWYDL